MVKKIFMVEIDYERGFENTVTAQQLEEWIRHEDYNEYFLLLDVNELSIKP